jgi:hypothetical protein
MLQILKSGWVSVFPRYLHVAVEGTTAADHSSTLELTRYRTVCISGSIIELVFEFAPPDFFGPGPRSVIFMPKLKFFSIKSNLLNQV